MSNPVRGCGTKKRDSFYAEGTIKSGGALHAQTWFLGDGVDNIIPVNIPPRKMMYGNIAATFAAGEVILADVDFIPRQWEVELFDRMLLATKQFGIYDHVGKDNYSAYSFSEELGLYGPSRKMPKETAVIFAKLIHQRGPLPIVFSHDRMPVFRSETQRDAFVELVLQRWPNAEPENGYDYDPVWCNDNWGMYARKNQYNGWRNYLTGVLAFLDSIDRDWKVNKNDPIYIQAKSILDNCIFQEQFFSASWITRISYTLPEDGQIDESLINIPGLNIIDLEKEDNE